MLRVKFADRSRPGLRRSQRAKLLAIAVHRLNRLERWLYNGLHSLDFAFWYSKRPLWDIGMILLCAGALVSSAIGLCLGVKRLWHDVARLVGPPRRTPFRGAESARH